MQCNYALFVKLMLLPVFFIDQYFRDSTSNLIESCCLWFKHEVDTLQSRDPSMQFSPIHAETYNTSSKEQFLKWLTMPSQGSFGIPRLSIFLTPI